MLGGISRKLAYRLLADDEIRSVKVGRTYKIPKACVIEYLLGALSGNMGAACHKSVEKSGRFSPLGIWLFPILYDMFGVSMAGKSETCYTE